MNRFESSGGVYRSEFSTSHFYFLSLECLVLIPPVVSSSILVREVSFYEQSPARTWRCGSVRFKCTLT
jgi:hypothetical protein